jgi:hypothetical protein
VFDKTAFSSDIIIDNKGVNDIYMSNFFNLDISLTLINSGGIVRPRNDAKYIYCKDLTLECKADNTNKSTIVGICVVNSLKISSAYNGYVEVNLFKRAGVTECAPYLIGKGFKKTITRNIIDKDIRSYDHYPMLIFMYDNIATKRELLNKEVNFHDKTYNLLDAFETHFDGGFYDKWIS